MSLTDGGVSLSDIAAVTNGRDGFGNDSAWWLIILFLFAFVGGWGNNGFGGCGCNNDCCCGNNNGCGCCN